MTTSTRGGSEALTRPDGTPRKLMDVSRINAIGWRATTLRTLMGLQVFIPNKKLAETVMINYTRDPGMAIELAFRSGLESEPEQVEAVVLDELTRAVSSLPGLRPDAPPLVRFRAFGEWGLEWRAYVEILSSQDRFFLRHELMKRLHRRLRVEQIRVPPAGFVPAGALPAAGAVPASAGAGAVPPATS